MRDYSIIEWNDIYIEIPQDKLTLIACMVERATRQAKEDKSEFGEYEYEKLGQAILKECEKRKYVSEYEELENALKDSYNKVQELAFEYQRKWLKAETEEDKQMFSALRDMAFDKAEEISFKIQEMEVD